MEGLMITGVHIVIYSMDAEKDRNFIRDILGFPHVDAGDGWLIFRLPPAEAAVHPSDDNDIHEFYLMCDDLDGFANRMKGLKVAIGPVKSLPWGLLSELRLPGGGRLKIYQPRHPSPPIN
jgi:hypothetical protein